VWHLHRRTGEGLRRKAYNYGVGLGGYLTKVVQDDHWTILDFAAAAPWALARVLNPASSKNYGLPEDYPTRLKWRERWGMIIGVPSYLRSRRERTPDNCPSGGRTPALGAHR
jgi:O-antigen biosynthesis protein